LVCFEPFSAPLLFVPDIGADWLGLVIILIAMEILVAAINIVVDLYAGEV
jgi:hypothetical protein